MIRSLAVVTVVNIVLANSLHAILVDFDDLQLAQESQWHGPDPEGEIVQGPYGDEVHGQFASRGAAFVNRFDLVNESWTGFAYSNQTDTQTPGYTNQFSAITGSGVGPGSDSYGVAYGYLDREPNLFQTFAFDPANAEHLNKLPYFDVPAAGRAESMHVTNTTYAVRSMQTGDEFAKKFGGESGGDPDWFKLSIYGTNGAGEPLANFVEFFLADYRGEVDTIIDEWTRIELPGLENARRLHFNLSSSDVGLYGMNTPAYFAIDNISIVAAGLAGDFDKNGDISGRDFLFWQRQFGASQEPFTGGDGDGDGQVAVNDLELWQASYGQSHLSVTNSTVVVVPEPSAFLLMLSVFVCSLPACRVGTTSIRVS